ncbi:MAG: hypothetical protein GY723_12520, partial [bacterium]|nr:hypothetical protein [bacterium]
GEFDLARRFCDEGGATGEPYWGESSYPLHALGLLFIASVSDDWDRAAEMLDLLVGASGAPVLVPSQAWALAAAGDHDRAAEALGRLRSTHLAWFGEHILGGNALIAAGEVALLIGDDELAASAFEHLLPFKDIVLGVPWACSFAAADTLSRLAAHRGDTTEAAAFADRACELYTSLDAPTLIARLDP